MSLTPVGLDSPDWTRNQGASGALLLNDARIVNGVFNLGPVYCGGWESLFVNVVDLDANNAVSVTLFFWVDAAMTIFIASIPMEVDGVGGPLQVVVPVVAPFVQVQIGPILGATTQNVQTKVVGLPQPPRSGGVVSPRTILNFNNANIVAGGNIALVPTLTTSGSASLGVWASAGTFEVFVRLLDANGNHTGALAYMSPPQQSLQFGWTVKFVLPPVRIRVAINNTGGAAITVNGTFAVE